MLLGSVSATVSAHAAYPLIVAAPADGPTQAGVVGADATPESLPVIAFGSYWDAAVVERAQSTVAVMPHRPGWIGPGRTL